MKYHDRHTISRLIGAAPGYVGFEEGGKCFSSYVRTWFTQFSVHTGQLTEAVRRKPYAVILLDELEKAHKVRFHLLSSIVIMSLPAP